MYDNEYAKKWRAENKDYNRNYYKENKEKWVKYAEERKGDFIYTFYDKHTNQVLYVGQTRDIKQRIRNHKYNGKIKELTELGYKEEDILLSYINFNFDIHANMNKMPKMTDREKQLTLNSVEEYLQELMIVDKDLKAKLIKKPVMSAKSMYDGRITEFNYAQKVIKHYSLLWRINLLNTLRGLSGV